MFDITPYLEVKPAPAAVFDRARATPSAPRFYVRDGDQWQPVSWGAFADMIAQVSLFLPGVGFDRGERAAIFADNSVSWAAAALGIQAAGGVMVPIYPASTPDQAGYIVRHADVRVLFVGGQDQLRRIFDAWPSCEAVEQIVLLDETVDPHRALADADPETRPDPRAVDVRVTRWPTVRQTSIDWRSLELRLDSIDLDEPALMLYTSGTSGRPKGVPLTHNNVGLNSRGWLECNRPDLHENAVDILWLPMSHIFGFGEMCLGNTLGFTSYLCSPKEALSLLPEIEPTVFFSVPAYWEKLASAARAGGDAGAVDRLKEITGGKLRFCLSGGAGLKREVKELFKDAGVLIIEGYGLTECSPTLTLNSRDAHRFDSVGKPLSNVEVRLADDGEIQARGPNVFSGYHKDEVATRQAFTDDGWFKTGDLGRFTDDGFLQIIGRKKEILVTAGGKNVPPANIELQFADDPDIEHLVVYGDGQKYLVAAVWLADGSSIDEAEVERRIAAVNEGLPSYETIKKFAIIDTPLTVEDGFLTSSLKLRRNQIYQAFGDQLDALYES